LAFYLLFHTSANAGTITHTVVDDKGSVTIPNGHFERRFGSRMTADLGPEWGDRAGHYERMNSEYMVWVNDGPPIVLHFANVYPKETHVPQEPKPDVYRFGDFFDVFTEIKLDGSLGPLEPGMQIQEGPDTYLEGSSGTRYPGKVTPINDLNQLPTSSSNGTQFVWDLSRFSTTVGNFFLIEYQLPPIELVDIPEPSHVALLVGLAICSQALSKRRTLDRLNRSRAVNSRVFASTAASKHRSYISQGGNRSCNLAFLSSRCTALVLAARSVFH
jgi:hypothetical protein